jgi:peptidoglycan hydrolase-like protein with peptidoglycan-binding domain
LFAVSVDCRLIDDGGKGASIASANKEEEMPNPGQPLIRRGDQGTAVFRAQRALRRTPDLSVALDGDFGPDTEAAVERFQEGAGLDVDGIVGDDTWAALPNGGPMPLLKAGSKGDVVRDLQEVLISGSEDGDWPSPGEADGDFGAETKASVEGFQEWGQVDVDGIVGDKTWAVPLHAANSTLETAVGLDWAED